VPADGWFEWQASDAGKVPYYITCAPDTDRILFMAGIWEYGAGDDPVCAIITEPAASSLAFIHSRQPVVLDPACLEQWLDPELVDREAIRQTVQRRDPESLRFWSVSSAVNRPGNDSPDLIEPVSPGT